MAEWVWEARMRTGEVRKGTMEAESAESVQNRLKAQNLSPVRVRKKGKQLNLSFGSPVKEKELVVFVRQFATMIDAGLPLVQCLEILASQGDNNTNNRGFAHGCLGRWVGVWHEYTLFQKSVLAVANACFPTPSGSSAWP